MAVEIDMLAAGEAHQLLLARDHGEQPLAVSDRHNGIRVAVQDQHRRLHLRDAQIGAELVLHQEPHRQKRVG